MQARVVGSGPAGLFAAEILAKGGVKVTIIDHHAKPSRKLLLAGRGGLNLTHSEPLQNFLARYQERTKFIELAVNKFTPDDLRKWADDLGIETFVGSSGRVFPKGLRTSPLLRAWYKRLEGLGVELKSATAWTEFDKTPTIFAMGGASWPELGSDAGWVKAFTAGGVDVMPFMASNSRQRVSWPQDFVDRFAGHPIKNVTLTCGDKTMRGEVMITKEGIEGGVVYALSQQLRASQRAELLMDLKPDVSAEEVQARLQRQRPKDSRSTRLRKALNLSPVAIAIMKVCAATDPKVVRIETKGSFGLSRAISSAGGVTRSAVDADFRLRKQPNCFAVGEMLDWDAPTGGYLLQACFSTAFVAASAMLEDFKRSQPK
jgi:uncharacterized flavoprotein (TIGR03862 family)